MSPLRDPYGGFCGSSAEELILSLLPDFRRLTYKGRLLCGVALYIGRQERERMRIEQEGWVGEDS